MLPAGTMLQGEKIRIEGRLGNGGFGITYRATHLLLDRTVAIKEFYPNGMVHRDSRDNSLEILGNQESFDRGRSMFVKEGQLLFDLQHPNIVRILDVFEDLGTAYISMEFLADGSLADELRTGGGRGLQEGRVRQVMAGVVSALAACHARGVYHLDLKPANVMLQPGGGIKLIDFGAARQGTAVATHSKLALTPAFAPPELLMERSYGSDSDIFEAGILLYLLLTGTLPPSAMQRMSGERLDLAAVPPAFQAAIESATQLERERRPKDIAAWWAGVAEQNTAPATKQEAVASVGSAPTSHPTFEGNPSAPTRPEPEVKQKPQFSKVPIPVLWGIGFLGLGVVGLGVAMRPSESPPVPPSATPPSIHTPVPETDHPPLPTATPTLAATATPAVTLSPRRIPMSKPITKSISTPTPSPVSSPKPPPPDTSNTIPKSTPTARLRQSTGRVVGERRVRPKSSPTPKPGGVNDKKRKGDL